MSRGDFSYEPFHVSVADDGWTGWATFVAAMFLGACIVLAALVVKTSTDRQTCVIAGGSLSACGGGE